MGEKVIGYYRVKGDNVGKFRFPKEYDSEVLEVLAEFYQKVSVLNEQRDRYRIEALEKVKRIQRKYIEGAGLEIVGEG